MSPLTAASISLLWALLALQLPAQQRQNGLAPRSIAILQSEYPKVAVCRGADDFREMTLILARNDRAAWARLAREERCWSVRHGDHVLLEAFDRSTESWSVQFLTGGWIGYRVRVGMRELRAAAPSTPLENELVAGRPVLAIGAPKGEFPVCKTLPELLQLSKAVADPTLDFEQYMRHQTGCRIHPNGPRARLIRVDVNEALVELLDGEARGTQVWIGKEWLQQLSGSPSAQRAGGVK